jgi:hypothetical protein
MTANLRVPAEAHRHGSTALSPTRPTSQMTWDPVASGFQALGTPGGSSATNQDTSEGPGLLLVFSRFFHSPVRIMLLPVLVQPVGDMATSLAQRTHMKAYLRQGAPPHSLINKPDRICKMPNSKFQSSHLAVD